MGLKWEELKRKTEARIGLTRHGYRPSHRETLDFQLAHALARDAVWTPWNYSHLYERLLKGGYSVEILSTQVKDRSTYLLRPDWGQKLQEDSWQKNQQGEVIPFSVILSDGLSAQGMNDHAFDFLQTLKLVLGDLFPQQVLLSPFSRVAIGDEIGELYQSTLSLVIIGERPGLSSPDSLGAYLTYLPRRGKTNADRNCVSNIRPPQGLSFTEAAHKIHYLVGESLRLKLSGVNLKEEATTILSTDKILIGEGP